MAPPSSGSGYRDGSDYIQALCETLSNAIQKGGFVRFPNKTVPTMKRFLEEYREYEEVFDVEQIGDLVRILDGDSGDVCARLNTTAFIIILQTLLLAKRCRSNERGVHLLAAALFDEKTSSMTSGTVSQMKKKKATIGSAVFQQLLECFTELDEENHMRVWVGLMTLLLLDDCEENVSLLTLGPEDTRRTLGPLIINETDDIVRIINGKLLRASRKADLEMEHFWPIDQDPAQYSEFPMSQEVVAWNQSFQNWVDNLHVNYSGVLHFANVVRTKPDLFEASGKEIDITVYIYEDEGDYELSIYVQARGEIFDQRLDMPLGLISNVKIGPTNIDSMANLRAVDLVMEIQEADESCPCFINAKSPAEQIREIRLTLIGNVEGEALSGDINMLKKRVEEKKLGITRPRTASRDGSNQSYRSAKSSQSAEVLHLTAPEESDQAEDRSNESALQQESEVQVVEGIQTTKAHTMHAPSQFQDAPSSVEMMANPQPAISPRRSPRLAETVSSSSLVSVNDEKSSSPDILQSEDPHKRAPSAKTSINKETAKSKSNSQKSISQNSKPDSLPEIPSKQTAAKKANAVAPESLQENENQSRRGRSSQIKPVKKVAPVADDVLPKNALAKNKVLPVRPRPAPRSAVQRSSQKQDDDDLAQPRTSVAARGKGKERLVDNSGISTDKSRSRTIQSPDLIEEGHSTSGITSPEEASTPKIVRNVALREKNARPVNKKSAAVAETTNLTEEAGAKPVKKYSLKAKPPVSSANPTAKNGQQRAADADLDLANKPGSEAVTKKTQAKIKPAALKSSNHSTTRANEKSTTEQKDIFDLPSDGEDGYKEPGKKSKARGKTSKPASKAPAASSKVTGKKAVGTAAKRPPTVKKTAVKKRQSTPAVLDTPPVATRSKRPAAVAASKKISQQSSSDNEFEDGNAESVNSFDEVAADKKPKQAKKPSISAVAKKATKVAKPVSTKEKDVNVVALATKTGTRVGQSVPPKKRISKTIQAPPDDDMAEPQDAVFQQLHEDALQLSLTHEQFDVPEQSSDGANPIPEIHKVPKKRNKMAARLTTLFEHIELEKSDDEDEDQAQGTQAASSDREKSNDETKRSLRERNSRSPLSFSSSAKLHSASPLPQPESDDQQLQEATQPEVGDLASSPRIERKRNKSPAKNASKRRRLNVQHSDPPASSKASKIPKKKAKQAVSKAVKTSTPPLRRSRGPARETEVSHDLERAIGRGTVLLDDRLARKTPLIAFGKTGPKNQGVSSSNKKASPRSVSLVVSVEGARLQDKLQNNAMDSGQQIKRRRDDEPAPGDQDDRPRKRIRPSQRLREETPTRQSSQLKFSGVAEAPDLNESGNDMANEVGNGYYDPGTPSSSMDGVVVPRTVEGADFEPVEPVEPDNLPQENVEQDSPQPQAQEASQSQKSATQVSKVDENGSPIGSASQSTRYDKLAKILLDKTAEEAEDHLEAGAGQPRDRQVSSFRPRTKLPSNSEPLSSNAKAKPAAPEDEREQYVLHRETKGDEYEDIASKEVVHSKRFVVENPFSEQPPGKKLGPFAERLQASRKELVEKRLLNPPVKSMQRSKSENDKFQPMKSDGLVNTKVTTRLATPAEIVQALPRPEEPIARIEKLKTLVEQSDLDARPKRKIAFELEQEQPDVDDQRKRRKPPIQVQEAGVNQERKRRLQEPPKVIPLAVAPIQDVLNAQPRRKSPTQVQNVQPDAANPNPRRKSSPQFENAQLNTANIEPRRKSSLQIETAQPGTADAQPRRKSSLQKEAAQLDTADSQPRRESSLQEENAQPNAAEAQLRRKSSLQKEAAQLDTADSQPRRKSSLQEENAQLNAAQPRRKSSLQKEAGQLDTADSQPRRKISLQNDNAQSDAANVQLRRKSAFQIENTELNTADAQPDSELPMPRKKALFTFESGRAQRSAQQQIENSPPAFEKQHPQRRTHGRPVTRPTRRSRTEHEDPEKTLVEELSSPPSGPSTGSSGLSHLSGSSSEASPGPAELSVEEEWGVELRSHERPMLSSLYRIVNGLVSHLVEQREAIEDIVDDYISGGTNLIELLESSHDAEKDRVLADFEGAKAQLSKTYSTAQRTISRGSKEAKATPISGLEKEWRDQHEDIQSFIAESVVGE